MAERVVTDPALIERLNALSAAQFEQTLPEFIDQRRGAPAAVREAVGSGPDQDRLANVRQYFPDAVPYEDNNFVYTDPGTGRKTLYNPPGLDLGDIASVARDAAVGVGATAGAVLGSGAGPGGTVAGAGLGAGAGGSLYSGVSNLVGGRQDTRGVPGVMRDAAIDIAGGAVGQKVGEVGDQAIKRALGAARGGTFGRGSADLVADAEDIGVPLTAGGATGSRMLTGAEKSMATLSPRLQVVYERTNQALTDAIADVTDRMGSAGTLMEAGGRVKTAAKGAVDRFKDRQSKLYDRAFDLVGGQTPVEFSSVKALADEFAAAVQAAPGARGPVLKPVLARANAILRDAGEEGLPFEVMREVRTDLGRQLKTPQAMGGDGAQIEAMRRLYGALTDDMRAVADAAGPEASRALTRADRYTRLGMNTGSKLLNKIISTDADEKAFRFALSGTKEGATNLRRLRNAFTPEEWGDVSATVLQQIGIPRSGAEFSVDTFIRNWRTLAPEVRQTLFGGTRYRNVARDLDQIVNVAGAVSRTNALNNTSNTANAMVWQAMLGAIGGGAGLAAQGDVGGFAGAIAGSIIAPRLAARLLTSPQFVRWLSTAPVKSENPNAMIQHISRLAGLAASDKVDREAVQGFLDVLRPAPIAESGPTQYTPSQEGRRQQ